MDEDFERSGKIIRTNNVLLLKIEKDIIIIDEQDFKLLKFGIKIPLFRMEGSLKKAGHQIGFAFLKRQREGSLSDLITGLLLDAVFVTNCKAYIAWFGRINEVFFEGGEWDLMYSESTTSLYGHLTFENSDWEDLYKNLKKYMNFNIRDIPDPEDWVDSKEYAIPDCEWDYFLH